MTTTPIHAGNRATAVPGFVVDFSGAGVLAVPSTSSHHQKTGEPSCATNRWPAHCLPPDQPLPGPFLGPTTRHDATAARAVALSKVYGSGDTAVAALRGVNVEFHPGQFTAIMGPSGSGKSTLMHCLAALDQATAGRVFIGDADLSTLGDKELTRIRRDRIGFVFQAFNLVPTLTAIENITLPMDIAGRTPDQDWLNTVITAVGLTDRLHHKPAQLSGGQQQRVACARALASRPAIIFADEPTGNLDSLSGGRGAGFPGPLCAGLPADGRAGHPRPGRRRLRRPGAVPGRRPDP